MSITLNKIGGKLACMAAIDWKKTTFAERFTWARKQAGYNQTQIAELIGVSRAAISQWETGVNKAELRNIILASKIAGVSPKWLDTGSGEPGDETEADSFQEDAGPWDAMPEDVRRITLMLIKTPPAGRNLIQQMLQYMQAAKAQGWQVQLSPGEITDKNGNNH